MVEIRPEVIELIAPVIEDKKTNIVRGDFWEHINGSPGVYDFIDLDIWPTWVRLYCPLRKPDWGAPKH